MEVSGQKDRRVCSMRTVGIWIEKKIGLKEKKRVEGKRGREYNDHCDLHLTLTGIVERRRDNSMFAKMRKKNLKVLLRSHRWYKVMDAGLNADQKLLPTDKGRGEPVGTFV
ncbi:MAG: hypothetical protein Q9226_002725 [Calogaya cf. arnoldii]